MGLIGGLGGFAGPVVFGYLLQVTGVWTTVWMFEGALAAICLIWMRVVVRRIMRAEAEEVARRIDFVDGDAAHDAPAPAGARAPGAMSQGR